MRAAALTALCLAFIAGALVGSALGALAFAAAVLRVWGAFQ